MTPCLRPVAAGVLVLLSAGDTAAASRAAGDTAAASPAARPSGPGPAAPSPAAGWTVLFDGSSTDAWRGYTRPEFPSPCWTIEGGALKTVAGAQGPCDMLTRQTFRDFELELEWKLSAGGNSGILYRVAEVPGSPAWHTGPELQILDDGRYGENPVTTHTAALYDLMAPARKTLRPVGEWNRTRLLVRGPHVEHWLNGEKVLEYELGSAPLAALVSRSKFKDLPRFAREPEGHVVLQHHSGGEVWFRDIRIRRLDAPAPPVPAPSPPAPSPHTSR